METSGVHAVFGVKATFITEILNRLVICHLAPLRLPEIVLMSSDTRGEVIIRIFEGNSAVEFALSAEIVHGVYRRQNKLRLSLYVRQAPPAFEEMLSAIEDSSPYEFSMEEVEKILPVDQVGLKVGGVNSDILLVGVEVHGIQVDWNRFYTTFVGDEVVGAGKEYGLFVGRNAVDTAIHRFTGEVLAATSESGVANLELHDIDWPGGKVMLRGTGTYTECWLFNEIDFWWKAPITLFAEDSAVYVRGQFHFDRFRGEEDTLQAAICELQWWDIFFGLATWIARLINTAVSGVEEIEITKELINMAWPQTGRLRPSSPEILTDGIRLQGKAACESGSSVASVPSEESFPKTISSPFGCLRPSDPIYGEVHVSNEGEGLAYDLLGTYRR